MTLNNLIVLQVGDGVTAIGQGKMAAVYIKEFTKAAPAVPVRSILVPGVSLPDTGDAYGSISMSLDGSLAVFAAYGTAVGASISAGLKGLVAVVAVNKWGLAKTRFFAKPASSTAVYAATTCDNNKFYISTDVGIYSSSFIGAPLVLETTSRSLSAYRLQCASATPVVSPNPNNGALNQIAGLATTQIFAGESFSSGGYVSEYATGPALTFKPLVANAITTSFFSVAAMVGVGRFTPFQFTSVATMGTGAPTVGTTYYVLGIGGTAFPVASISTTINTAAVFTATGIGTLPIGTPLAFQTGTTTLATYSASMVTCAQTTVASLQTVIMYACATGVDTFSISASSACTSLCTNPATVSTYTVSGRMTVVPLTSPSLSGSATIVIGTSVGNTILSAIQTSGTPTAAVLLSTAASPVITFSTFATQTTTSIFPVSALTGVAVNTPFTFTSTAGFATPPSLLATYYVLGYGGTAVSITGATAASPSVFTAASVVDTGMPIAIFIGSAAGNIAITTCGSVATVAILATSIVYMCRISGSTTTFWISADASCFTTCGLGTAIGSVGMTYTALTATATANVVFGSAPNSNLLFSSATSAFTPTAIVVSVTSLATPVTTTASASTTGYLRGFQVMSFNSTPTAFGYGMWFADSVSGLAYSFSSQSSPTIQVAIPSAVANTAYTLITTAVNHGMSPGDTFIFSNLGTAAFTGVPNFPNGVVLATTTVLYVCSAPSAITFMFSASWVAPNTCGSIVALKSGASITAQPIITKITCKSTAFTSLTGAHSVYANNESIGVGTTSRLWATSSSAGSGVFQYKIDSTVNACKSLSSSTACATLLNSGSAVLTPDGGGLTAAAFRGLGLAPYAADVVTAPTPLIAGNLLVARVSYGTLVSSTTSGLTSSTPSTVWLDEYTSATVPVFVQSIQISSNYIQAPFLFNGGAVFEGLLAPSPNNYFVSMAAWDTASKSIVIAKIYGNGAIDYSTRMYYSSGTAAYSVASSVITNAGDVAFFCRTAATTGVESVYIGAGGYPNADTATPNTAAACTYAGFSQAPGAGQSTLYVASTTASAGLISLSLTSSNAVTGWSSVASAGTIIAVTLSKPRQFAWRSSSEVWIADYGTGVRQFTCSGPCGVATEVTGNKIVPASTDTMVIGVAIPSTGAAIYISTTTGLAMTTLSSTPGTPGSTTPVKAVSVASLSEFRGLAFNPSLPAGGAPVYPSVTSFATGNFLALRASDTTGSASMLYLDEINLSAAVVTGYIVENVLTITDWTSGALAIGQTLSGSGVADATYIVGFITGTGTTGTYTVTDSAQPAPAGTVFTASAIVQSWPIPSSAAGGRGTLPGTDTLLGKLATTTDGKHAIFAAYDSAAGGAVGSSWTVARVSCRGYATFTQPIASLSAWYAAAGNTGTPAGTFFIATGAGVVSMNASATALNSVAVTSATGRSGVALTYYSGGSFSLQSLTGASSGGAYLGFAASAQVLPLSTIAADTTLTVANKFFDPSVARGTIIPALVAGTTTYFEYWYPTDGGYLQSVFRGWSGSAMTADASSRGYVQPLSGVKLIAAIAPVSGPADGTIIAASTTDLYSCKPLACGPGTSSYSLSSVGFFRLNPGASYASGSTCTVSISLASGFRAKLTVYSLGVGTSGTDTFKFTDTDAALDIFTASPQASFTVTTTTASLGNVNAVLTAGAAVVAGRTGLVAEVLAVPYACGSGPSYAMTATKKENPQIVTTATTSVHLTSSKPSFTYGASQTCDWLLQGATGQGAFASVALPGISGNTPTFTAATFAATIASITFAASVNTVNTQVNHGLSVNQAIVISGATTAANNGIFTVLAVNTVTQFTVTNAAGVAQAAVGGLVGPSFFFRPTSIVYTGSGFTVNCDQYCSPTGHGVTAGSQFSLKGVWGAVFVATWTTTTAMTLVSVTSGTLAIGMPIICTGCTSGTTITNIVGTAITLSAVTTAAGTAIPVVGGGGGCVGYEYWTASAVDSISATQTISVVSNGCWDLNTALSGTAFTISGIYTGYGTASGRVVQISNFPVAGFNGPWSVQSYFGNAPVISGMVVSAVANNYLTTSAAHNFAPGQSFTFTSLGTTMAGPTINTVPYYVIGVGTPVAITSKASPNVGVASTAGWVNGMKISIYTGTTAAQWNVFASCGTITSEALLVSNVVYACGITGTTFQISSSSACSPICTWNGAGVTYTGMAVIPFGVATTPASFVYGTSIGSATLSVYTVTAITTPPTIILGPNNFVVATTTSPGTAGAGSGTVTPVTALQLSFAVQPANIYSSSTAFFIGFNAQISAFTYAAGTWTITTSLTHGLAKSATVAIEGVVPAACNGVFTVASIISTTQFTITNALVPTAFSIPTISAAATSAVVSAITTTGKKWTVTTATSYMFAVGNSATIAGAANAAYNGVFTVASVLSATQFTIASTANPGACSASCGTVTGLWAFVSTAHTFVAGNAVYIAAVVPANFNGLWRVNAAPTTLAFTVASYVSLTYTSGGTASGAVRRSTFDAHGVAVGQTVTLTGVSPPAYNGKFQATLVQSPWQFMLSSNANPAAATVTGLASPIGYSVASGDYFTVYDGPDATYPVLSRTSASAPQTFITTTGFSNQGFASPYLYATFVSSATSPGRGVRFASSTNGGIRIAATLVPYFNPKSVVACMDGLVARDNCAQYPFLNYGYPMTAVSATVQITSPNTYFYTNRLPYYQSYYGCLAQVTAPFGYIVSTNYITSYFESSFDYLYSYDGADSSADLLSKSTYVSGVFGGSCNAAMTGAGTGQGQTCLSTSRYLSLRSYADYCGTGDSGTLGGGVVFVTFPMQYTSVAQPLALPLGSSAAISLSWAMGTAHYATTSASSKKGTYMITYQVPTGFNGAIQLSFSSWSVRMGDTVSLYDGPDTSYTAIFSTSISPAYASNLMAMSSGNALTLVYSSGAAALAGVSFSAMWNPSYLTYLPLVKTAQTGVSQLTIVSIAFSTPTVTITTVGAHGFVQYQSVTITGATAPANNGVFFVKDVTTATSTTFTLTNAAGVAQAATAGFVAATVSSNPYSCTRGVSSFDVQIAPSISSAAQFTVSSIALSSGNTWIVTTSLAHGFIAGQTVSLWGATVAGGLFGLSLVGASLPPVGFTIAAVPSTTTFTVILGGTVNTCAASCGFVSAGPTPPLAPYLLTTNPTDTYGSSVGCAFSVTAPTGYVVSLSFPSQLGFSTEQDVDILNIFDGPSPLSNKLSSLSGSTNPATVVSTKNVMHITFTSNAAKQYSGVQMLVSAKLNPSLTCSSGNALISTTISTTLVSSTDGTACSFSVTAPSGFAVVITYPTANSLAGTAATWTVYDGKSSSSPAIYTATSASVASAGLISSSSTGQFLFITSSGTFTTALSAKISFIAASTCSQIARIADSSHVWLGTAPVPQACGWNDRRLGTDEDGSLGARATATPDSSDTRLRGH